MLAEYQVIPANETNVSEFINKLVHGAKHFRYFQNRPVNVIYRHLVTLIVVDNLQNPVAYGHLEKEDNRLWLGVAVADCQLNKGLGSLVIQQLINVALQKSEPLISLSVDKDNHQAIGLYKKFLFKKKGELSDSLLFELELN